MFPRVVPLVPTILALVAARPVSASPCDPSSAVRVEVTTALGEDDDAMRAYLGERLPDRLGAAGLCLDEDAPHRVVAEVAWSDAAAGDYAISLRASAPNAEPYERPADICHACATAEVLDQVVATIPLVLEGLHVATAPTPASPVEAAPPPVRGETPPATDRRPRFDALAHAGLGLAIGGTVAMATGAALWSRGRVVSTKNPEYAHDLRPPGIAMVVTGVLAVGTGATMLALSRRRARRLAIAPSWDGRVAALRLSGGF